MSEAAPCMEVRPLGPEAMEHARRMMDDAMLTLFGLGYRDLHMGPRDGEWHVIHGKGHPKSSPKPRRHRDGDFCVELAAWCWQRTGEAPPPWAEPGSETREFVVRYPPYLRQQNWDDWLLA